MLTDKQGAKNKEPMIENKNSLMSSFSEKDELLKEINHRIKNNLQIIISLLKLQSYNIHEKQTIATLNKIYNRIRSIGIAYDTIDDSKDASLVKLSVYIRNLVNMLTDTNRTDKEAIRMSADVADIAIDLDTAILCGMIINELVSNALKYAFPGSRGGHISVRIHSLGNNYVLTVGDNGVGLPEECNFYTTESLGLKIVRILAKQLDASVEVDRKSGSLFTIRFLKA